MDVTDLLERLDVVQTIPELNAIRSDVNKMITGTNGDRVYHRVQNAFAKATRRVAESAKVVLKEKGADADC